MYTLATEMGKRCNMCLLLLEIQILLDCERIQIVYIFAATISC